MSVGLLVITHGQVGEVLLAAAVDALGEPPMATQLISITADTDPEDTIEDARRAVQALDSGSGVLVLTDMYGSTPSNIACAVRGDNVAIVAGINLPMLIRVINYHELDLAQVRDKALSGGRDGIVPCGQRSDPQ
jgi:PTS system mannose-specific IIA component